MVLISILEWHKDMSPYCSKIFENHQYNCNLYKELTDFPIEHSLNERSLKGSKMSSLRILGFNSFFVALRKPFTFLTNLRKKRKRINALIILQRFLLYTFRVKQKLGWPLGEKYKANDNLLKFPFAFIYLRKGAFV